MGEEQKEIRGLIVYFVVLDRFLGIFWREREGLLFFFVVVCWFFARSLCYVHTDDFYTSTPRKERERGGRRREREKKRRNSWTIRRNRILCDFGQISSQVFWLFCETVLSRSKISKAEEKRTIPHSQNSHRSIPFSY